MCVCHTGGGGCANAGWLAGWLASRPPDRPTGCLLARRWVLMGQHIGPGSPLLLLFPPPLPPLCPQLVIDHTHALLHALARSAKEAGQPGPAAEDTPGSLSAPSAASSTMTGQQQAVQQCVVAGEALEALLRANPLPPPGAQGPAGVRAQAAALQRWTQLEPAAVCAAEALEAWWETSGTPQRRRLHLARAATTRCCAYLR